MSRLTLLMPDLNARLGHDQGAIQQMLNISATWDTQGTLPDPPFTRVTPNIRGHGELWYHGSSGLYVMRTEHRPVLLTTERCATCGLTHLDVGRIYLMMSPIDFDTRAYAEYAPAPVPTEQPASTNDGA